MKHAGLAVLLAGILAAPAQANTRWSGSELRVSIANPAACTLQINRATANPGPNPVITARVSNFGTARMQFVGQGQLTLQSRSTSFTFAGQVDSLATASVAIGQPFAGSLMGSVLELRITSCGPG